MTRVTTIAGVKFHCARPGLWFTEDYRHAIVAQNIDRAEGEWVLFRTLRHEDPATPIDDVEDADFWCGEAIGHHITMGELDDDVAEEFLTDDQVRRVLRAFLGVPRKNAYHRSVIADARSVLDGNCAARGTVATAWLRMNDPAKARELRLIRGEPEED